MSGAVLSYQQKDPMIIIDSKSLPIPVLATGKGWLVVDKPADPWGTWRWALGV